VGLKFLISHKRYKPKSYSVYDSHAWRCSTEAVIKRSRLSSSVESQIPPHMPSTAYACCAVHVFLWETDEIIETGPNEPVGITPAGAVCIRRVDESRIMQIPLLSVVCYVLHRRSSLDIHLYHLYMILCVRCFHQCALCLLTNYGES